MSGALLLDALGTLVALEDPAPRLRNELARRFGFEVSDGDAARAIGAEIAYYRSHLDEGRDQVSLRALRRRCAMVLSDALSPPQADLAWDLDELTEALLASLRFTAFPDAEPAISLARAGGQRVVVVSNWDVSLHDVLERVGLRALLNGILTSAEAGFRKPSSEIFEKALGLAGVAASDAVHVGDSFEEDVLGARSAGIRGVLLLRGGRPGPDHVHTISSLRELT